MSAVPPLRGFGADGKSHVRGETSAVRRQRSEVRHVRSWTDSPWRGESVLRRIRGHLPEDFRATTKARQAEIRSQRSDVRCQHGDCGQSPLPHIRGQTSELTCQISAWQSRPKAAAATDSTTLICAIREIRSYTFLPNFFSSSANEIWIMVGRPCGQQ